MKHKWILGLALFVVLGAASGCGRKFEGTYAMHLNGMDVVSAEFRSGGVVQVNSLGTTSTGTYRLEGDRVVVNDGGRSAIFRIGADGSLTEQDGGMVLKRKD